MDHKENGLFRLKPDIVLYQKKMLAVIDTKYKLLSETHRYENVSQSDVYQMYAYGAKTGAEKVMLLYPDDGDLTYINWKMEYDNGRQADLFIRSVTLSLDLIKDWSMFLGLLTRYIREVCPQHQGLFDGLCHTNSSFAQ